MVARGGSSAKLTPRAAQQTDHPVPEYLECEGDRRDDPDEGGDDHASGRRIEVGIRRGCDGEADHEKKDHAKRSTSRHVGKPITG